MSRFLRLIPAAALVLCLGANVHAANVFSLLVNGNNTASDEDRAYLLDTDFSLAGSPGAGIQGQIDVGDSFRGLINFNTVNSAGANVGGLTGNNELSGVVQAVVTSKILIPLGAGTQAIFTIAPDPAFESIFGRGAMAVLFDDATPDYTQDFDDPPPSTAPPADADADLTNGPSDDGTPAVRTVPPSSADVSSGLNVTEEAFIATATDGARFLTVGFTGPAGAPIAGLVAAHPLFGVPITTAAPGEGAVFSTDAALAIGGAAGDNILTAFTIGSGTSFGNINLGFNQISLADRALGTFAGGPAEIMDAFIFTGVVTPFGIADFNASVTERGVNDLDTSFELASNTNANFAGFVIPEPTSLALFGLGGLALAAGARRRRRAAAL